MVDRRPAVIVRCAGDRDIVAGIRAARDLDLELGVRCGGHSAVGHAVPDGRLVLDLTPMARPASTRSGAGPGCRAARCSARSTAPRRRTPSRRRRGTSRTPAFGGLTLGGGMGWLARRYGLTCDNLQGCTLVTADGAIVRVSGDEHPDLFWALRGGGGNFGVVAEFEFALHPAGTAATVVGLDFPLDRAVPVLQGWRDVSAAAPRQATFTADLARERLTVGYVWVGGWAGDFAAGQRLLMTLSALGRPMERRVVDTDYLTLQTRDDSVQGHTLRRYARGHYVRTLSDEMIKEMVAGLDRGPFAPSVGLQAYGGAFADVPDDATAFSHRDALFELSAAFGWTDPGEDTDRIAAARAYGAALEPFASGAYVNALGDEGAGGVARAYPPSTFARLAEVKATWDPDNVFHRNANIRPTLAGAPR